MYIVLERKNLKKMSAKFWWKTFLRVAKLLLLLVVWLGLVELTSMLNCIWIVVSHLCDVVHRGGTRVTLARYIDNRAQWRVGRSKSIFVKNFQKSCPKKDLFENRKIFRKVIPRKVTPKQHYRKYFRGLARHKKPHAAI